MINTVDQVQNKLSNCVDIIDAISFKESISFKDYKLLQKVEKFLFKLSYSVITDNEGVLLSNIIG